MSDITLRGIPLHLHPPGEYVSDVMRETGDFYEADILDEVMRRLATKPAGVIVDVGAMIGTHTVFLAAFARYTEIHAFEPCKENFLLLVDNTAHLRGILAQLVSVYRFALSDHRASMPMGVSSANMGHAAILATDHTHDRYDEVFPVKTRQLDDYRFKNVRLIKIDVEGHEPQVLAGARETIDRCHPMILIEDWHRQYGPLLPGYRVTAEWWDKHQTLLYEWEP